MVNIMWQQDNHTISIASGNTGQLMTAGKYSNVTEPLRLASGKIFLSIEAGTEGDFTMWGISDGDLSLSEIEECIESSLANKTDVISQERSRRKVFPICVINHDPHRSTWEGHVKINQTFNQGFDWWCYNPTSGAVAGSPSVRMLCKWFGVWVE